MHHYGWSGAYPGGWMILHGAFWILLLGALLIGTILLLRLLRTIAKGPESPKALDILDQRYARGEIDRNEYLRCKSDILGDMSPPIGSKE